MSPKNLRILSRHGKKAVSPMDAIFLLYPMLNSYYIPMLCPNSSEYSEPTPNIEDIDATFAFDLDGQSLTAVGKD